MNLTQASTQWANRAADERYYDVADALPVAERRAQAREVVYPAERLEFRSPDGRGIEVVSPTGGVATPTNWAFGQLCRHAEAPPEYLRGLPGPMAASLLSYGLSQRPGEIKALVDGRTIRAATTDHYARVWDAEVLRLLSRTACAGGWRTPRARGNDRLATAADVMPGSAIREGEMIGPAGVYLSDRNLFVFLIHPTAPVEIGERVLYRGAFVENSEVGAGALKVTSFLFDFVCGNHIVWGAQNVRRLKVVHRGSAIERFHGEVTGNLRALASADGKPIADMVGSARRTLLGSDQDEVVETVYRRRLPQLTQSLLTDAFVRAAATPAYGDPRSVWGIVNGLTELSQKAEFADKRSAIDVSAGRLLDSIA